jgi:hypothetical protein
MENHRLIEHRVTIAEAQTGAAFTSIQGRVEQYSLHRAGLLQMLLRVIQVPTIT